MVRACAGDLGFFFTFGGLATLSYGGAGAGESQRAALVSRVGLKIVLRERLDLILQLGGGFEVFSLGRAIDDPDKHANWGMSVGAGLYYHFRVWRRISPFVGAVLGFGYNDPSGSGYEMSVGVDGVIGVEYYVADRVSLSVLYLLSVSSLIQRYPGGDLFSSTTRTSTAFTTGTGGLAVLTLYF